MPQIVCRISLDVAVSDSGQCLMAKQGDTKSRLLCVSFTDCGQALPIEQESTVLLNINKNGESKAFAGFVQADGSACFTLPDFLLAESGRAKCDVSALDGAGARLTGASFEILVEEAVCPDAGLAEGEGRDVINDFLATERFSKLQPYPCVNGYAVSPVVCRKYFLDLSDPRYRVDGTWVPITVSLPAVFDSSRDYWILICCHAPVDDEAGPVTVDWGPADKVRFVDGMPPDIYMGDFDVVCTCSPTDKIWQVGVVQYGRAKEQG